MADIRGSIFVFFSFITVVVFVLGLLYGIYRILNNIRKQFRQSEIPNDYVFQMHYDDDEDDADVEAESHTMAQSRDHLFYFASNTRDRVNVHGDDEDDSDNDLELPNESEMILTRTNYGVVF